MNVSFEDLIALWSRPVPAGAAGVETFARVYADPVMVNGVTMTLAALVERARATQSTFADLSATLLARSDTPTHTTLVFRMRGRHVGPLTTPLGQVPPTGKVIERQIIDLLGVRDGRVAEIWMVGDELAALMQMQALRLA